jgi:ribose/xylose/arabinose/galactoside ABC-type transport system permease subunit
MIANSTSKSDKETMSRLFNTGIIKAFIRTYGTLLFTLIIFVIFSFLSPYFFQTSNIMNIFRQAAVVTVISLGLTVVLAGGNFDISVANVAGLANVITAFLMREGLTFGMSAAIALAAGAFLGAINGFMVAKLRINTFLATVAMMFVACGFDILLSDGVRVMIPSDMLNVTRMIGVGSLGPIPYLLIILLGICALCYIFMNRTRYGRNIYAIGGNPRCAHISGIPLQKYTWLTFIISGVLAASGGVLLTTRLSSGVPLAGASLMGSVINATYIGMTVVTLGIANVPGTLLGGLLLAILENGLGLMNVPFYYQYILWGAIVVVAVSFSGGGLSDSVVLVKAQASIAGSRLRRFVSDYATPLLMVLIAIVLGIMRPTFLEFSNLMSIFRYAAPVAVMAIGLMFTIAGGGFDISVGSIASLSTVLVAFMLSQGHSLAVAILAGLASGLLAGLINGLLCGRLGLNPFVGTLAVLLGAAGPQFMMSNGGTPISVRGQPVLDAIGKGYLGPVPILVLVLLGLALLMWFIFNQTKLGAYISALGGSPKALYVSGVNIKNISTVTYVISGLMCAVAGILLTARLSSGLTKVAEPYLMDAIAAVFLGATFFSRGRPHVMGTLAGAVFMGMTNNGLTLLGVPFWGDYLFRGLMVYFAVGLSGMNNE